MIALGQAMLLRIVPLQPIASHIVLGRTELAAWKKAGIA